MKKILLIFFIGQMLLISFIFNQSIYDVYTLNNKGERGLESWNMEGANSHVLKEFYHLYEETYSDYSLQIIKMPMRNDQTIRYEIYHNHLDRIDKQYPVANDTEFRYDTLEQNDFIDSTGTFETDLPEEEIHQIAEKLGVEIQKSPADEISYKQIIRMNEIQFVCLLVLTQIMLIVNVFIGMKGYAVKKILGFSSKRILRDGFGTILFYNMISYIVTFLIHVCYLLYIGKTNLNYLVLLGATLTVVMFINLVLYWVSQPFVNFITIKDAIKNSIYSKQMNAFLFGLKLVFIFVISGMVSLSFDTYQKCKASEDEVETYMSWKDLYTCDGYNGDEYEKTMNDPEKLKGYMEGIHQIKKYYEEQGTCYLVSASAEMYLGPGYLEMHGLEKDDIYHSYEKNYLVANKFYIQDFCELRSETGELIQVEDLDPHTILVPEMYKNQEKEIKTYYSEKYNDLYNYNEYYGLKEEQIAVNDLSIVYIENDQEMDVVNYSSDSSGKTISNAIVLLDSGMFGEMYYFDSIGGNGLFFQLADRNELSRMLES